MEDNKKNKRKERNNMKKAMRKAERVGDTVEVVGEELPDKDSELFKDIGQRLGRIKMNTMLRKRLANKLSVEEKRALAWESVSDAFMCVDTCRLAMDHPKDAAGIVRAVAAIVSLFVPVVVPIAITLATMPDENVAKIAMYCGSITPEHIINKAIQTKMEYDSITEEDAEALYNQRKGTKVEEPKEVVDIEVIEPVLAEPKELPKEEEILEPVYINRMDKA